jgi:hypothetical protein
MPYGIVLSDSITDSSGGVLAPSSSVFRNRLINSDMRIDQRNAGASVTPTTQNQYTLDRWSSYLTQASKYSVQQNAASVTPPVGFTNYLGATSLSAYSVTSTDGFAIQQRIEGLNVADLAWGTANAATVTLSFWVRSSLTGTFGGSVYNSAANRFYPFSYTINSANTWEKETITIAGDTSGTWLTTNGVGVLLSFGLGAGSTLSQTAGAWTASAAITSTGATSVVGTNGATFYITGVQLEKGSTATSFDYRPYGTELMLCQRYLPAIDGGGTTQYYVGQCASATQCYPVIQFPVSVRTQPTGITLSAASSAYSVTNSAAGSVAATAVTFNTAGFNSGTLGVTVASGLAAGNATLFNLNTNKIFFTGCEL